MYENIPLQGNLHGVFSQLSIHNEKNIRNLKLKLSYRQFLEIYKNEGVKVSWDQPSLSGDVYFRQFNFDSLIMPDRINFTLTWKTDTLNKLMEQKASTVFPSKNLLIQFDHFNTDSVLLSPEFKLSDKKYKQFIKMTVIVNHYYGYGSVFERFRRKQSNKQGVNPVISYLEVNRALLYVQRSNIENFLNLRSYDPEKFLQLIKKTRRIETRRRTLAKQFVNRGSIKGMDTTFAESLVKLSVDFLTASKLFQPYIAASYEQMAQLVDDAETFNFYQSLCDAIDKDSGAHTPKKVFNEFIAQSNRFEQSGEYVYSLLMLDNAALWSKHIKGEYPHLFFLNQLGNTLDGMLASYLSVAAAGFKSGNLKMSERYLDEAKKLLVKEIKKYPALREKELPHFHHELFDVIRAELDNKMYKPAIDLMFRFRETNFSEEELSALYAYKKQAHYGLLLQKIAAVQTAENNGYQEEAYNQLMNINNFLTVNPLYLNDDSIADSALKEVTKPLINYYVNKGEDELKRSNGTDAMESFGKAFELQRIFMDSLNDKLQRLMNKTSVAWLKNKIEEAELLVWSNKMVAANNLYSDIIQGQIHYHLENNTEINKSIAILKQKMDNRKCVNAQYAVSNFLQVAQNRINADKWLEAAQSFEKAGKIIHRSKGCAIDTVLYKKLDKSYGKVLAYSLELQKLKNDMAAYGYKAVWQEYAALDAYYERHCLMQFKAEKPGLFELLKRKNDPEKVSMVARWYLDHENSVQAYRYLTLLKTMKWKKLNVNELQVEVARKMAVQIPPTEFDKMVDVNDKWFRPLIKTYRVAIQ